MYSKTILCKLNNQNNRQAAKTARWLARQHPVYAELAKGTWKSPYNFALADWWHAPMIHQIKRQKGHILVEAADNIMVARVRVSLLDEQGKVLEKGEGIKRRGDCWEFATSTTAMAIMAEAWDLAENVTRFVLE